MDEPKRRVQPTSEFELLPFLRSPGCALLFVMCYFIGGCVIAIFSPDRPYQIATFDCGKDRAIVFLTDRDCDESKPIYYEVRIGGQIVVPRTIVYYVICGHSDVLLDMRLAEDGDVVGIAPPSESWRDFWVVHDFRDGASWPRGDLDPMFVGSGKFTRENLEDLLRNESSLKPANK